MSKAPIPPQPQLTRNSGQEYPSSRRRFSRDVILSFAGIQPSNYVVALLLSAYASNIFLFWYYDPNVMVFLIRQNRIVICGILLFVFLWMVKLFAYLLLYVHKRG